MAAREYRRMIRKMGFISDQEGIINRYLREKEHWELHLSKTKNFITECFTDPGIQSVAVMGSGWLLDVPLNTLSNRFNRVLLLDIHHPPQARKKAEHYKNVLLQEVDLTGGGAAFAWNLRKKSSAFNSSLALEGFNPQPPRLAFIPDAFISLNLLNQLDILIIDYIKKKHNGFMPEEYYRLRKIVQQFHVQWISEQPGCLISDMIETEESMDGTTETKNLVHAKLPESRRSEEWIWDFDLSGTYIENKKTRFTVRALEW
jgi:hypothetical protein